MPSTAGGQKDAEVGPRLHGALDNVGRLMDVLVIAVDQHEHLGIDAHSAVGDDEARELGVQLLVAQGGGDKVGGYAVHVLEPGVVSWCGKK